MLKMLFCDNRGAGAHCIFDAATLAPCFRTGEPACELGLPPVEPLSDENSDCLRPPFGEALSGEPKKAGPPPGVLPSSPATEPGPVLISSFWLISAVFTRSCEGGGWVAVGGG